jgi:hypothetical protein
VAFSRSGLFRRTCLSIASTPLTIVHTIACVLASNNSACESMRIIQCAYSGLILLRSVGNSKWQPLAPQMNLRARDMTKAAVASLDGRWSADTLPSAVKAMEDALQLRRTYAGKSAGVTADACDNLGMMLCVAGKYFAAIEQFEEGRRIRQELHKGPHISLYKSYANLARVYKIINMQKQHAEAAKSELGILSGCMCGDDVGSYDTVQVYKHASYRDVLFGMVWGEEA